MTKEATTRPRNYKMTGSYIKSWLWVLLGIIAVGGNFLGFHDQKTKKKMMVVVAEAKAEADVDCQKDLLGLEIECLYYMHKGVPPLQDPNERCCKVIQAANIPCVCTKLQQHITIPPGYTIEDMLDWKKVLHCLNFCGKPLHLGFKCGHFTVPPGPPLK